MSAETRDEIAEGLDYMYKFLLQELAGLKAHKKSIYGDAEALAEYNGEWAAYSTILNMGRRYNLFPKRN